MPGVIHLRTEIPGPASRALAGAPRRGGAPRGAGRHADRSRARRGCRPHRRRRQSTDRFRRRHRRGEHRAPPPGRGGRRSADQLDRFAHVCFPGLHLRAVRRSGRAAQPGDARARHEKRTFFVNSGAEAVENAVKVARAFTGRQAVVCFEHGFHGRTNLAMALTSKVMPYKKGFGPFAPEVYRMPFPYCYRCERGGPADGGPADGCCMASRRVARTALRRDGGSGLGGGGRHGAGAGRGRLRSGAGRVRPDARRLREASTASCSSPTRSRPASGAPGGDVRLRALRPGARPHHDREVPGRRAAARGRHRPGRGRWKRRRSAAWAAPTGATRWPAPPRSRCSTRWSASASRSAPSSAGDRIAGPLPRVGRALSVHRRRARARRDGREWSW